jgi:hypothetical protein
VARLRRRVTVSDPVHGRVAVGRGEPPAEHVIGVALPVADDLWQAVPVSP